MVADASPPAFTWFPLTRRFFRFLRGELDHVLLTLGAAVVNTGLMLGFLLRGRLSLRHYLQQAGFVGLDTLGIALVLCNFSAAVIALQMAREMARQGAGNYIGALVSLAVLRELAPIMTAVAVVAMAGSAFAAELATMQITKQVDALRVLHVHPVRYLLLPRVLGAVTMMPAMTTITAVTSILSGLVVSALLADIHPGNYLDSVWNQTELKDVLAALLKAGVFGYLIAMFSATIGLNTTGGAREVGMATTRAVVWSFLIVAIFDYLLTYLIYGSR